MNSDEPTGPVPEELPPCASEEVPKPPLSQGQLVAARVRDDFLSGQMGKFFRTRALAWMDEPSQPEQLNADDPEDAVFPATTNAEQVRLRLGDTYTLGRKPDVAAVSAVDAFMMAHHAGESLLRHFFAVHDAAANNGVAWLEMAKLQGARAFSDRVEALLAAPDAGIAPVVEALFIPPGLRAHIEAEYEPGGLDEVSTFCIAWLKHFAREFVQAGRGYNACKHGLSVVSGFSTLSVYVEQENGTLEEHEMFAGNELRTLEYKSVEKNKLWEQVARYVDPPGLVASVLVAADLLDWMWAVQRGIATQEPVLIEVYCKPLPADVVRGQNSTRGQVNISIGALALHMQPGPELDALQQRLTGARRSDSADADPCADGQPEAEGH